MIMKGSNINVKMIILIIDNMIYESNERKRSEEILLMIMIMKW